MNGLKNISKPKSEMTNYVVAAIIYKGNQKMIYLLNRYVYTIADYLINWYKRQKNLNRVLIATILTA